MAELDVIYSKITMVKNCLKAIERAKMDQKDPFFQQNIYELNLQRAIKACIDMANVVIAKEGLGLPSTYRQSFNLLGDNHIITPDLQEKLIKMVGFRNISVHDYSEVRPEIIQAIVDRHLKDFEVFYTLIYNYVQNWS